MALTVTIVVREGEHAQNVEQSKSLVFGHLCRRLALVGPQRFCLSYCGWHCRLRRRPDGAESRLFLMNYYLS